MDASTHANKHTHTVTYIHQHKQHTNQQPRDRQVDQGKNARNKSIKKWKDLAKPGTNVHMQEATNETECCQSKAPDIIPPSVSSLQLLFGDFFVRVSLSFRRRGLAYVGFSCVAQDVFLIRLWSDTTVVGWELGSGYIPLVLQ